MLLVSCAEFGQQIFDAISFGALRRKQCHESRQCSFRAGHVAIVVLMPGERHDAINFRARLRVATS